MIGMNNIHTVKTSNIPASKTAPTKKTVPLNRPSIKTQAEESGKATFLGYMLSYLTLPGLRRPLPPKSEVDQTIGATGAEPVTILGHGNTLTGGEIKLSGYLLENQKGSKKWIVYFLPNRGLAEASLKLAKNMSEELNANVLVFNYRGFGNSTGHPSGADDLVDDGAACFEYLKEMGVQYSDICAYGHSIGGGVAAKLLAREKYNSASLIADRTFTTFGDAVEQAARTKFSLSKTVAAWAKSLFQSSGWNFNSVANLEKIKGKVLITSTQTKHDKMVGECQLANGSLKIRYTPCKLEPKRESNYIQDHHSLDIMGPKCRFADQEIISSIFRAHLHTAPSLQSARKWNSFTSA